jgi:hypothetical protein
MQLTLAILCAMVTQRLKIKYYLKYTRINMLSHAINPAPPGEPHVTLSDFGNDCCSTQAGLGNHCPTKSVACLP